MGGRGTHSGSINTSAGLSVTYKDGETIDYYFAKSGGGKLLAAWYCRHA